MLNIHVQKCKHNLHIPNSLFLNTWMSIPTWHLSCSFCSLSLSLSLSLCFLTYIYTRQTFTNTHTYNTHMLVNAVSSPCIFSKFLQNVNIIWLYLQRTLSLTIISVILPLKNRTGGGGIRKPTYESEGRTRRVVPREAVLSEYWTKMVLTSPRKQPTEGQ